MTNNPVQKPLPVPPPRARQETVSFEGERSHAPGTGSLLERAARTNNELERRIAELERENARLVADNATKATAIAQLERTKGLLVQSAFEDEWNKLEKATKTEWKKLEEASNAEWEKFHEALDGMIAFVQNVTGLPAEEVEQLLPPFIAMVCSRATAEAVTGVLSERAPATIPIRDSSEDLEAASHAPPPRPKASRSPRPAEPVARRSAPITMPPVVCPSTPPAPPGRPSETEILVDPLDPDNPDNPGRATLEMVSSEPPPAS